MKARIIEIIAHNLNLDPKMVEASASDLSFSKTNGWDSLAHLSIMTDLEDEFNVEIDIDDMEKLVSVSDISDYISSLK